MNKTELIAAVAEKAEISKKDAEKAVKALVDTVTEEMVKGEKVQLVGFGTFEVSERAAREGRNPRSGETVTISHTWENSSSPRSASALRYSGLNTTVDFSSSTRPLCRGMPNLVGKSLRRLAMIFIGKTSCSQLCSSISHSPLRCVLSSRSPPSSAKKPSCTAQVTSSHHKNQSANPVFGKPV